jgi:uncharacterized protein YqeY
MSIVRLIHAALKERDQKARSEGHADGLSDDQLQDLLEAMVDQRRGGGIRVGIGYS